MLLNARDRSTRLGLTALAAAAATAGVGGAATTQASAQSTPLFGYAATAAADGVRVIVEARGYILVDRFVDLGAPAAQALLDSSGLSQGFAAAPDPGELLAVAPGLLSTVVPVPGVALPPYPLVARSEHPTSPSADLSSGPYVLEATSDAAASHARAEVGGRSGDTAAFATRAIADVVLDPDLGKVTATASAVTEALDLLGGLLRLGRVEATASIAQSLGDEAPVTRVGFEVTGASILGLGLSITDEGVVLAGQGLPLGLGDTLSDLLSGRGLDIRVLPAVVAADSVQSAGLEIRQQFELPNAPEPATLSIVLGQARASLAPPRTDDPAALPVESDTGAMSSPLTGSSDTATAPSASFERSAGGSGNPPGPAASARPTVPRGTVALEPIVDRSLGGFYLVLVLAAIVVVGGGQLVRLLSVRWAWTR